MTNVESQLQKGLLTFVKDFQEYEIDAGDYIHVGGVYDGLDDSGWDIRDIYQNFFPNLHRCSVFMTLYSVFENDLNRLCQHLEHKLNLKLKVSDLSGKGIDRAKLYLTKVANLDLSALSSHQFWNEIKHIQQVRNAIVHRNAQLDNDKTLRAYIESCDYLTSQNSSIILLEGFLAHVLSNMRGVYELISEQVRAVEKNGLFDS